MAVGVASWNTAFGTSGSAGVPVFDFDDEVFLKSDHVQTVGQNASVPYIRYCVIGILLKGEDAIIKNLAGTQASPDPQGADSPFFYRLQNVSTEVALDADVHESDVLSFAEYQASAKLNAIDNQDGVSDPEV